MAKPNLLGDYLHDNDLTQGQFAAKIGRNSAAVSRWVRGERRPNHEVAVEIELATRGRIPHLYWLSRKLEAA